MEKCQKAYITCVGYLKKVMASYTSKMLTCFIFTISLYLTVIEIVSGGSLLPEETWTDPKEDQLAELITFCLNIHIERYLFCLIVSTSIPFPSSYYFCMWDSIITIFLEVQLNTHSMHKTKFLWTMTKYMLKCYIFNSTLKV